MQEVNTQIIAVNTTKKMNSYLTYQKHQNFEHNIKKEPEEEFLFILPSYDNAITQERDFVYVKQENKI